MNPIRHLSTCLNRSTHARRWIHRARIISRYYLTPRRPIEPFFVVSAGRDGSNLLVDYLNSLPGVAVGGEVLSTGLYYGVRRRFITKAATLRHIRYSLHDQGSRVCGVKLHFAQIWERGISLDDVHRAFPTARFIFLYRRSIARQFISTQRAVVSGQWLLRKHEKPIDKTVHIDPDALCDFYERIKRNYLKLLELDWIKDRGVIISYEDLADHPQSLFDETICPFLGLAAMAISTQLVKQNTKPMHEMVENYDQVKELLNGDIAFQEYRL